ncbi:MAG: tripartite tricarboxylate transporter substrate binding protein [Brachybacterium sp.]|nr:tripartite tricarboxylate transporter substrate binding protein [Brachybacterium sp.]
MIVPFSAGGGSDLSGRAIAEGLEETSGATIRVENIVGGSGAVGYAELMNAEGDGNVLLASEIALMTLPIVQDVNFTYESFTPIMKVGDDYRIVVVRDDAPYETMSDLVEAAKESTLSAAVSGVTGPDNIAWSLLEEQESFQLDRVNFESSSEVLGAVLGGHVDVAGSSPGALGGQLESGDLRALCVLAPQRYEYEGFQDIPTAEEEGYDVAFSQWRGFIAPGGISDEARQYWIEKGQEFAETDVYTEYIEANLLQPEVLVGDEFMEYLHEYDAEVRTVLDGE